jgi:hypothetical protein
MLLLLASLGLVAGGSTLRWVHRSCDAVHHAAAARHAAPDHHEHHQDHADHGTTDPSNPEAPSQGDCITCLALNGLVTPQVQVSVAPVLHAWVRTLEVPRPRSVSAPRPPRVAGARPPPQA